MKQAKVAKRDKPPAPPARKRVLVLEWRKSPKTGSLRPKKTWRWAE